MTGIASGRVLQDDISLTDAANVVKEENARVAQADWYQSRQPVQPA
jgi:hypothetical protein